MDFKKVEIGTKVGDLLGGLQDIKAKSLLVPALKFSEDGTLYQIQILITKDPDLFIENAEATKE